MLRTVNRKEWSHVLSGEHSGCRMCSRPALPRCSRPSPRPRLPRAGQLLLLEQGCQPEGLDGGPPAAGVIPHVSRQGGREGGRSIGARDWNGKRRPPPPLPGRVVPRVCRSLLCPGHHLPAMSDLCPRPPPCSFFTEPGALKLAWNFLPAPLLPEAAAEAVRKAGAHECRSMAPCEHFRSCVDWPRAHIAAAACSRCRGS